MKWLLAVIAATQIAIGAPVFWTDWTSSTDGTAAGTITTSSGTVGVTYTGNIWFAQTDGGINYWSPSAPYISADVDNAPPAFDIIAINGGLMNTVTFSEPVLNPLLAIASLNGPGFAFEGSPSLEVLSSGCGYWGCGTLQAVGNTITTVGGGEGHGVVRLNGVYTSFTFSGGAETWRGIQVGITDIADGTVPEPGTWAMLVGGGIALLAFKRVRSA
jgi:hypothetical protein